MIGANGTHPIRAIEEDLKRGINPDEAFRRHALNIRLGELSRVVEVFHAHDLDAPDALMRRIDPDRAPKRRNRNPFIQISDVPPERLNWAWRDHIVFGKLNAIVGDGDLGKTTIAIDICARFSLGGEMPDGTPGTGACGVLYLSGEDGAADTLRPRFDIAGGDGKRFFVIDENVDAPLSVPECIPLLETMVKEHGVRVIVFDPFDAFLTDKVNSWSSHDTRRALRPLKSFAERLGVAVIFIMHFNKKEAGTPLYRVLGTIGLANALRMIWMVAPDPNDDTRRITAPMKANITGKTSALAYRLEGVEGTDHARVVWEGATRHTVEALLGRPLDEEQRGERDEAREFLRGVLSDGPVLASEVKTLARQALVSERTLMRAKKDEGVISKRDGFGRGSRSYWELPHTTTNAIYVDRVASYGDQNAQTPLGDSGFTYNANAKNAGILCESADRATDYGDENAIGCQPSPFIGACSECGARVDGVERCGACVARERSGDG